MTSQQIAKICGVSRTTVSRVINNDPNVKAETREMVLAAMKEHNYVPIASARRLAGIDSNIIGLFVMEMDTSESRKRVSGSTYFSHLISLIVDQANNNGFHTLVFIVTSDEQLMEARNLFLSRTISSGIFVGVHNDTTRLDDLCDVGMPMVIIDRQVHGATTKEGQMVLNLDNAKGAYLATKHLIHKGHSRIAHITGDMRKLSAIDRFEGYKKALEEAGIACDQDLVYTGDFMEETGYAVTQEMVAAGDFTAVFAANDAMAIGVVRALQNMGKSVPKDVAVVGFDNIDIGSYLTPRLTTIDAPFEQIAEASVASLQYYYQHKSFKESETLVETKLIERESV